MDITNCVTEYNWILFNPYQTAEDDDQKPPIQQRKGGIEDKSNESSPIILIDDTPATDGWQACKTWIRKIMSNAIPVRDDEMWITCTMCDVKGDLGTSKKWSNSRWHLSSLLHIMTEESIIPSRCSFQSSWTDTPEHICTKRQPGSMCWMP